MVPTLILKIVKISMGLSTIVAILINIFPRWILSIYGQDEAFITAGIPVMRVVTGAMVCMSFAVVWMNAVTGTGNSRYTLYIEATTIILYCIFVYLVLEKYDLSIVYGWMSEWLYWLSIFTLSWLYMRSGKWKGKVI